MVHNYNIWNTFHSLRQKYKVYNAGYFMYIKQQDAQNSCD